MKRSIAVAVLATACATSSTFRQAEKAERREDYDQAVLLYSRAVQENPESSISRASLERARTRASQMHSRAADRLTGRGLYKEALDELRLAKDLMPDATSLEVKIREVEQLRNSGLAPPAMEELKEAARERPLGGLALGPEAQQPLGLSFRRARVREAYQALGRAVGVNFVFDPQVSNRTIDIDLRDIPFEQAMTAMSSVSGTFHVVVDARLVSVIPDTAAKRREFQQQVVKTFFLSNADLKETVDLLRIVLGARRVAPLPGSNAVSINDTPEKVAAAERIINIVDKRRAEVMVEVEMLEVNRSLLQEYGIEITSPPADGVFRGVQGGAFPRQPTTADADPYDTSNIVITSLPGVVYRLLRSDSTTRILANPQLRTSEGQTAEARFGDQVPVPVTTFSPIAQGGISQQPITSFEYKDVGVNIDVTPRVHHDGEVTLDIKLDISQVGPVFQGLPTFNSRTVSSVIRLRDGETSVLAGLITDTERETIRGLPGLHKLPFIGRLFSYNSTELQQTDVIMTLTPRVLSRPIITADDLRSFAVGSDQSPLLFEVPASPSPGSSTGTPQRMGPIRPPPEPTPTPTPSPNSRQEQ